MQDIYIVGAGGFGREVQWLIERINNVNRMFNIKGYIDDGQSGVINGYPVIDTVEGFIKTYGNSLEEIAIVCAIGNSKIRKRVVEKFAQYSNFVFPNLIDPSVIMSERIELGSGNIICAGNILTVNIRIGSFNIINLDCTIGHDAIMEDYVTIYPSVNVSGATSIGNGSELGTGSQVIQGLHICSDCVIGAGAVVVKHLEEAGTYVGVPAKKH